MLWRYAITLAVLIGTAGIAPVAAKTTASVRLAAEPADSVWPVIVPRLASYTDDQKATITQVVEHYCAEHPFPKRSELQAQIQKVLTPKQVIEAIRYWLPQNAQHDLQELLDESLRQPEELDACDRPVRTN